MSPALTSQERLHLGRDLCGDLQQAERREWWLANGTGAYAAGTVAGTLTRRYHGLLIAPIEPPLGRVLVAVKADTTLTIEDEGGGSRNMALFSNRWADGSVNPSGYLSLESFALDGRMPVWRFRLGMATLEMRIWMEPGAPTTYVAYRLESAIPIRATLRASVMLNARDHHGNTRSGEFAFQVEGQSRQLRVTHDGRYALEIMASGPTTTEGTWYEHFLLKEEAGRGLPEQDNHFCAGHVELSLTPGQWTGMAMTLAPLPTFDLEAALQRFRIHDHACLDEARALAAAPAWIQQLVLAADSFLIARPIPDFPQGRSVIAGYPWFGDWGRDTMIALPGLTLATGRAETARSILMTFARFIDRGQLPNVFPGTGSEPAYNTVDAALWFIEAWRAYIETTGDLEALRQCWAALDGIVQWHLQGTRFGIGVDPGDGLLRAGEPGVQLTWMDAKVGDWVVTPRIGKPVEVNALWFNAVSAMAEMAALLGLPADGYRQHAEAAHRGFQRFLNPANGGLFDVLDGPDGNNDDSVRPNQVFAVSLTHSPLDATAQSGVLKLCARHLLTSYGLRSLSPLHKDYCPRYEGGVYSRDGGYHQGTVWPWLLGHFAMAQYRVTRDADSALALLTPVGDHLLDAGLGTVSEILDGDEPHLPRGAPAQAWSVGCTLEAWWRLQQARSAPSRRKNGRKAL